MAKTIRKIFDKFAKLDLAAKLMKSYNPGNRIVPSRSAKQDQAFQARLDAGELVDGRYRQVYLQVNGEATSTVLKDWVRKHGTHANLATGRFDTQARDPEAEAKRLFDDLANQANNNL